jgi:hypothetical protein
LNPSEAKSFRQNTCEAAIKIEVAALKKTDLDSALLRFPVVRKYMHTLAIEKNRYY